MTIIRTPKTERPYFSMARETAQDRRLTFEARGMLAYLLSKPNDWEVEVNDLKQQCGRDRVYRIINELLEANYLKRENAHDGKGKFSGYNYQLYETPFTEKPYTAPTYTENTYQTYIENQHTRESTESFAGVGTPASLEASADAQNAAVEPSGGDESTRETTARPIDAALKDAVAIYVQGIKPELAGKLTGQLAQTIAGVWRKRLNKTRLSAEDYAKIVDTIAPFVSAYKQAGGGQLKFLLIPAQLESWYAKVLPLVLGEQMPVPPEEELVPHPILPHVMMTRRQRDQWLKNDAENEKYAQRRSNGL